MLTVGTNGVKTKQKQKQNLRQVIFSCHVEVSRFSKQRLTPVINATKMQVKRRAVQNVIART